MKKLLIKTTTAALLSLAAGCFSMESACMRIESRGQIDLRTSDAKPVAHTVVSNSGWYLFNACPLICGNPREGAFFPWRFFSNCVNHDLLQDIITKDAAQKGCRIEDLYIYDDDFMLFTIPGLSIPIPLPYVLTLREMQISCVYTQDVPQTKKTSKPELEGAK